MFRMADRFASAWTLLAFLVLTGTASAESLPRNPRDMLGRALDPYQAGCPHLINSRPLLQSISSGAHVDCKPGAPNEIVLPITSSFIEQRMDRASVTDPHMLPKYLSDETNSLARSAGTFALLDTHLAAEFEFGHSRTTRPGILDLSVTEGMAARVGLKGEWGGAHYWAEYSYFDTEYTNLGAATPRDQAGAKFGAEWDLELLKPRFEFTHFHNNVAGDPERSQTTTSKGLVSLDLAIEKWPTLKVAYGGESKETASKPNGTVTEEFFAHTLTGTLAYQREVWEAYLTSAYTLKQDQLNRASDTAVYAYVLGGVYRPLNALSITPRLKFSQEFDGPTDVRTETLAANLGFSYLLLEGSLTLSLNGAFIHDRASDRSVDSQTLKGSFNIVKHFGNVFGLPHEKASLSLKTNYSRTADRVSENGGESFSALLLFEVIP